MPGISDAVDRFLVLLYFVVVAAVSIYSFRDGHRRVSDYSLAGRQARWPALALALFSGVYGAEYLIGWHVGGAQFAALLALLEIAALGSLWLLAIVIGPVLHQAGVTTVSEYLQRRFGSEIGSGSNLLQLSAVIFLRIPLVLFVGGLILEWMGFTGREELLFALVTLAGVCALVGGMRSVLRTQVLQGFIVGAAVVVVMASVAGENLPAVSRVPAGAERQDLVGSIVALLPLLVAWYGCCDQSVVQRVLSARKISDLQKGIAGTSTAKMLVIVGALLFAPQLFSINASMNPVPGADAPFVGFFPGARGLLLAAGLSLLMSILSSAFQSVGALAASDFLPWIRRDPSAERVILIGRLFAVFVAVLTVVGITLLRAMTIDTLAWLMLIHVLMMVPLMIILVGGALFRRVNRLGALAAVVGSLGGSAVFLVVQGVSSFGGETEIAMLSFANVVALVPGVAGISVILLAAVSLLTAAPREEQTYGLTLPGRTPVRSAV